LNKELKNKIEAHFEYRWEHDKLQAFRDAQDISVYDQMPDEVKVQMFI
jgi:hypothetical protein